MVHIGFTLLSGWTAAIVLVGAISGMAVPAKGDDGYTLSVTIKGQPDDVWGALVTKSIVDTYFLAPINGDITASGQMFFYGAEGQPLITGTVLELQPPEVFKHSFKFAGAGQTDSTVTYSLSAADDATRLTVTHNGYGKDTQSYADVAGGWPHILGKLKTVVEAN